MSSLLKDILIGFAFIFVIEGLAYALVPRLVQKAARLLPEVPEERLRVFGVAAVALGVFLVWRIRG